jgi:predicted hotdog family 3-hydroxylacyl-ACP dehydratase
VVIKVVGGPDGRLRGVLEKLQIEQLIPHAGAMCLLDRVLHWDADSIECAASGHRALDNPLRRGDRLPISAGIEYAAQAVAVHGGLLRAKSGPGAARRGYLAVLNDVSWQVERLDLCSGPLLIRARQQIAGAEGASYQFNVSAAGALLLEGRMTVALEAAR